MNAQPNTVGDFSLDWEQPISEWFEHQGVYLEDLGDIGQGRFGEVVLARVVQSDFDYPLIGQEVVLKQSVIIHGTYEPLVREHDILHEITPLGIGPQVYACESRNVFDEHGSCIGTKDVLAIEFIDGSDLYASCDYRGMPIPMVLYILAQVSSHLFLLHDVGYVHMDIKGDNIMLNFGHEDFERPTVRIIGFSQTKSMGDLAQCGTPSYTAPEHVEQYASASSQSDVYSLAHTMLHILYPGIFLVYQGNVEEYDGEVRAAVDNAIIENLGEWRDGYQASGALTLLLNKMLQGKKANRIPMRTVAIISKLIMDGLYNEAISVIDSDTALVYHPPRRSLWDNSLYLELQLQQEELDGNMTRQSGVSELPTMSIRPSCAQVYECVEAGDVTLRARQTQSSSASRSRNSEVRNLQLMIADIHRLPRRSNPPILALPLRNVCSAPTDGQPGTESVPGTPVVLVDSPVYTWLAGVQEVADEGPDDYVLDGEGSGWVDDRKYAGVACAQQAHEEPSFRSEEYIELTL